MMRWNGSKGCNYKRGMALLVPFMVLAVCVPAWAMEFTPFDSFAPYESPQLQPFSSEPSFKENEFAPYSPGPKPPNVQMPEYQEKPYGNIKPPEEPNVEMNVTQFRNYNTFKPIPPVREGPMRPMQPFDFNTFKPLGHE